MLNYTFDPEAFPRTWESRNLIRFCRHPGHDGFDPAFVADYALRAGLSRFSVLKNARTLPGPDECFGHIQMDARPVFDKMLGLELEYPELAGIAAKPPTIYNSMNYFRSHIEERFYHNGTKPLPPVEGVCVIFCPQPDVWQVTYRLRNTSLTSVAVRMRWVSIPAAGLGLEAAATATGLEFCVQQKVRTPYGVFVTAAADFAGLAFEWTGERFLSQQIDVQLDPGRQREWSFRFALDTAGKPSLPAYSRSPDVELAAAVERVERAYAHIPKLKGAWSRFDRLVLNAAGQLLNNSVLERAIDGRRVPTIRGGKTGLDGTWFWDSAIYIQALGLLGEKDTAQGAVELLLEGVDRQTGAPPAYYVEGRYAMTYQQPTLAWGVSHLDAMCPDADFLRRCLPAIQRYVEHWFRDCDSNANGLVEYPPKGVCWDDALRWQDRFPLDFAKDEAWAKKNWGGMRSDLFENVDTNTHLYLECRALERMHLRLGDAAPAAAWADRAARLAAKINEHLYDPKLGIYQDRSIVDGRFTGMLTLAAFLPVYAGIAPHAAARKMCRRYLLDPDHFNTPMPFCTLDRSHPAFRSGGFLQTVPSHPGALVQQSYWIGRTWPNVNIWMLGALWRAGLKREADAAALRMLDCMDRHETTNEIYDPLTGTPSGHPECTHGGSAALAYALGLYRHDPVPMD